MSHAQNNWQPTATIASLKQRAKILESIREFFQARAVLEVETPIMAQYSVTDPYITALTTQYLGKTHYLQTSPEYHMKRLLAAGSGDIFQIGKQFRHDHHSRIHNPEFTMLEWYRLGFDHHQLMDEMDELLQLILHTTPAVRYSYQAIFEKFLRIDPLTASIAELRTAAEKFDVPEMGDDRSGWLQLLFTEGIERQLLDLTFIYDFPAEQASLARLNANDPRVASRFEVYCGGIELANGFHELADAKQQLQRFESENQMRLQHQIPTRNIDPHFIAALEHGLPDCAGIALGVDRLIMLALQRPAIKDVISFDIERA